MDPINVNYKWTSPGHVTVLKDSCLCNSTGIFELYICEDGKETSLLIDIASESIRESLKQLENQPWYKLFENVLLIRFLSVSYPMKWISGILSDVQNNLIDIYRPKFNFIPISGVVTSHEIRLKMK